MIEQKPRTPGGGGPGAAGLFRPSPARAYAGARGTRAAEGS